MLANGYADEMLYERGALDRLSLPFDEWKRRSHINERARAANDAPDFSERIRTHFAPEARELTQARLVRSPLATEERNLETRKPEKEKL